MIYLFLGYYSYNFKTFTNNGIRTEIKCIDNKCETKTTPVGSGQASNVKVPEVVRPVPVQKPLKRPGSSSYIYITSQG